MNLDLPEIGNRHDFNLERWKKVCADPVLAAVEGRVETDAFGRLVVTPPPGYQHSRLQYAIARKLGELLGHDGVSTECPVSTEDGIRGVDVVWISADRREESLTENVLLRAPEICIEVISPGNTRSEMEAKRQLLFAAGADEVWLCDQHGQMAFFLREGTHQAQSKSERCPAFPQSVA